MYTILFGIGCYIIVLRALIARTEQLIFASLLNKISVNASFSGILIYYADSTDCLKIHYEYDEKDNITTMYITHALPQLSHLSSYQKFTYDEADQLITAVSNGRNLYHVRMSYGNYGRIKHSDVSFTG